VTALALLEEQAYVAGRWVDSDDGATFEVSDPATGETIATVPRMGAAETRRAIEAAQEALPGWRAMLARDRARILRRWADSMLEHQEELATLLTSEQGKPLAEARVEIAYAASFFEWFGEEAKRVYGDTIPTYAPDRRIVVTKEPVGVTAGITPWNFPAAMPTRRSPQAAPWSSNPPSRRRSPRSRSCGSARRRGFHRACFRSSPAMPRTLPRSAAR
jgi:succinate-semialdehyde dehydrogenase / glutarate-semialdehyde dehydrogenase